MAGYEDYYAPGQLTIDNIIATHNWLMHELTKGLEPYEITLSQYRVLQLLAQTHPDHLTVTQIGERLIDRTPDVTRLLDRLSKQAYILRSRAAHDKRIVEVRITEKGVVVLKNASKPLEVTIERLSGALNNVEHHLLVDYLERLRREPL